MQMEHQDSLYDNNDYNYPPVPAMNPYTQRAHYQSQNKPQFDNFNSNDTNVLARKLQELQNEMNELEKE